MPPLDQLLHDHLGYVHKEAIRYSEQWGVDRDDLVQEGLLAICQAHARFDASFGNNFLTYAAWGIRRRMRNFAFRNCCVVRTPYKKIYYGHPVAEQVTINTVNGEYDHGEFTAPITDTDLPAHVARAISSLKPREARTIRARFFEGLHLKDIAARENITGEAVRQRVRKSLKKLRRLLADQPLAA